MTAPEREAFETFWEGLPICIPTNSKDVAWLAWSAALKVAPAVTVTEEMVMRGAKSLAKVTYPHLVDRIDSGLEPPHMRPDFTNMARDALEAALKSPTPQTAGWEE